MKILDQADTAPWRAEILRAARAAEVTTIRVEFYGSGDSGTIETPTFEGGTNPGDVKTNVLLNRTRHMLNEASGVWEALEETFRPTLSELVAQYAEGVIDRSTVDWYNNEGGGGHLDLNISRNLCDFNIYQNELIQIDSESWVDEHFARDFPYNEIKQESGDYFRSIQQCLDAGYRENQIWSVCESDSENPQVTSFCYGPSHHIVNLLGYVCTSEAHDNNTYFVEQVDVGGDA